MIDYGHYLWFNTSVKEVAISEFKAKCLALLEQVRQTKKPLRVTRFGKPVAEIMPPSPDEGQKSWIGSMKDTMDIVGDIVSPVIDEKDIEALRD
jgi:prevent-host-death family protein